MSSANTSPPSVNPSLRGGMAPFAATREQSIADSVENAAGFQQAFPDIDWKARVIEPTVNLAFDLQQVLQQVQRDGQVRYMVPAAKKAGIHESASSLQSSNAGAAGGGNDAELPAESN
ncbi:hypothetical protein VTI74DRAFT_1993 [Chaetomium olivicolor]